MNSGVIWASGRRLTDAQLHTVDMQVLMFGACVFVVLAVWMWVGLRLK